MTVPTPRAILFDWDNTLVNTWPIIHESLSHTLQRFGKAPWTLDEVKAKVRRSMRDAFPELFGDGWEEAAKHYQDYYRSIHLRNLEALPQAQVMLERLQQCPVLVGVVSNKRGDNLRKEVAHLEWGKYFSVLVGAGDAARDKPHPDPMHYALRDSEITTGADVWFLGDSDIDLECAQATGCTPLLYGNITPDEQAAHGGFPFAHHSRDHAAFQQLVARFFSGD